MKNVKPGHNRPVVCLDAGHYGKWNRSPAVPAYYESVMVWKLHLLLKAELEAYGIEVKQTRTSQEKDLAVYKRGAASKSCDLFLSIHSNAVGSGVDESTDYPVSIVQLDGKGDALGTALANAVAVTMGTKQPGTIYKRKGTSGEWYGVLRGAASVGTMGIILEHSFHTNTKATQWLMNDANLSCMAKAEAAIIADWFGMVKQEEPTQEEKVVVLDSARSFNKAKAGTYKVKSADGVLNLRAGASADKPLIEAMPTGSKVMCYGYYTGKWLYVVSESGKTGFCHSGYLVRS